MTTFRGWLADLRAFCGLRQSETCSDVGGKTLCGVAFLLAALVLSCVIVARCGAQNTSDEKKQVAIVQAGLSKWRIAMTIRGGTPHEMFRLGWYELEIRSDGTVIVEKVRRPQHSTGDVRDPLFNGRLAVEELGD